MILVDRDLHDLLAREELKVLSSDVNLPFEPRIQVGPASIDLRLGLSLRRYKADEVLDLAVADATELVQLAPDQDFQILPNELWLAATLETVMMPPHLAGLLTGRSSLSRMGLLVQCSQELIQPGYADSLPLQLINLSGRPLTLRPYLRICQLILLTTSSDTELPYYSRADAKYRAASTEPEPSRIGIELGLESADLLQPPSEADAEMAKEVSRWKEIVGRLASDSDSWMERVRRLEESLNSGAQAQQSIADFLAKLAGPPLVNDVGERSTFREDAVITLVRDLISTHDDRALSVLDACCGLASWLKLAPSALGALARRIHYVGVDSDAASIQAFETGIATISTSFASCRGAIRDVTDLNGLAEEPFDLILLHNTLHELCPSTFPAMLHAFWSLLRQPGGKLSIIDMESLPSTEPEANAVMWSADEVVEIAGLAGFSAARSTHRKKVSVFSIEATVLSEPGDHAAVAGCVLKHLRRKRDHLLQRRRKMPRDPTGSVAELLDWLHVTCLVARSAEAIERVELATLGLR